jgi:response regulator RpfG family c-di-GMP phosphodiesterase
MICAQAVVLGTGLALSVDLFGRVAAKNGGIADQPGFSRLRHETTRLMTWTGVMTLAMSAGTAMALMRRYDTALVRFNQHLEQEVERRMDQALTTRHALIFGLAKLADYRDTDTGKHLERISGYCKLLADELRKEHPEIDDEWIERLMLASSLHDIGKVGIPDSILLKPGALTPTERRLMEQHPLIGGDTLIAIRRRLGDDELLNMGIQIALEHHEKWDGSGYPFGLRETQITFPARLVALADIYDALTSKRVYKDAMPHHEAVSTIRKMRGSHLDPDIVDAFMRVEHRFAHVRRELSGDERHMLAELAAQAAAAAEPAETVPTRRKAA